jgi:hypothetical protein
MQSRASTCLRGLSDRLNAPQPFTNLVPTGRHEGRQPEMLKRLSKTGRNPLKSAVRAITLDMRNAAEECRWRVQKLPRKDARGSAWSPLRSGLVR